MSSRLNKALVAVTVSALSWVAAPPAKAADVVPQQVDPLYLQIIAHQDDDLYFMNPDVDETIRAGLPSITVYLTAGQLTGNGSTDPQRARNRQRGAQNAYATMAGVADGDDTTQLEWQGIPLRLGSRTVELYVLRNRPDVELIFLNLHDGSLRNIDTGGADDSVVPLDGVATAPVHYTRADLVQTLVSIMNIYHPTVIRSQDAEPDRRAGYTPDHTDHVSGARFARDAAAAYPHTLVEANYRDYNIADVPQNISADQVARKTQIARQYFRYDTAAGTSGAGDNWLNRMYRRWPQGSAWAAADSDGDLQAFVVLSGRAYSYAQNLDGFFFGAEPLADPGGRLAPGLSVVRGTDGRLYVFAHRLTDHRIVLLAQNSPGGDFGTTWTNLGSPNAGLDTEDQLGTPAAAVNADGRLQLFVKNGGGGLSSLRQNTAGGTWNPTWLDLGGTDLQDGLSALRDPQNLIEVYASTRAAVIRWVQGRANGDVVRDPALQSSIAPASPPQAIADSAGRSTVAYRRAGNGNLMLMPQTAVGSTFRTPVDLAGPGTDEIATVLAADRRLMLAGRNGDGGVSISRQTSSNISFSGWGPEGDNTLGTPAAVLDNDGRVTLFSVSATGLSVNQQSDPGLDQPFQDWRDLGM